MKKVYSARKRLTRYFAYLLTVTLLFSLAYTVYSSLTIDRQLRYSSDAALDVYCGSLVQETDHLAFFNQYMTATSREFRQAAARSADEFTTVSLMYQIQSLMKATVPTAGLIMVYASTVMPVYLAIPLVLVVPGGGLSTGAVFSLWDQGGFADVALDCEDLARAVTARRLDAVDRLCANALTAPAVSLMPEIGQLTDSMRQLGAGAAFMTGSGSAVVGAFDDPGKADRAARALPGAILTSTMGDGGM